MIISTGRVLLLDGLRFWSQKTRRPVCSQAVNCALQILNQQAIFVHNRQGCPFASTLTTGIHLSWIIHGRSKRQQFFPIWSKAHCSRCVNVNHFPPISNDRPLFRALPRIDTLRCAVYFESSSMLLITEKQHRLGARERWMSRAHTQRMFFAYL